MDTNKKMRVGMVTFEQYHRKANIGSTRIRCDWPIKYWEDAERYHIGRNYDVIIYQKAYWVEHAKLFKGIKILDLCDADWLSWGYAIVEMIENVDAVTCSTKAIAEFIVNVTDKPVWVIPDRIDLDVDIPKKEHQGELKKAVWYGYSHNQEQIAPAIQALIKRDIELFVISEKPYILPSYGKKLEITNLPWSKEHWMNDILKGDVVLCPNNKKGRFQYKSENKTIQAWALGMPVAHIDKDLDKFASENARKDEASLRLKEVDKKYNVKDSVKEYQELIDEIIKSKKINDKRNI